MLETERLILRNYKMTDLDDFYDMAKSPNVGPMAGWQPHKNKQESEEILKKFVQKPLSFAIVLKEENKVIGTIELMEVKRERYNEKEIPEGSKEIGYVLNENYWNKGIMTEAAKEIMRYAFCDLKVPSLYICHAKANLASGRVQEKLGFTVIGEFEDYRTWIDGTKTGCVSRKMTKEEYFKRIGDL